MSLLALTGCQTASQPDPNVRKPLPFTKLAVPKAELLDESPLGVQADRNPGELRRDRLSEKVQRIQGDDVCADRPGENLGERDPDTQSREGPRPLNHGDQFNVRGFPARLRQKIPDGRREVLCAAFPGG